MDIFRQGLLKFMEVEVDVAENILLGVECGKNGVWKSFWVS